MSTPKSPNPPQRIRPSRQTLAVVLLAGAVLGVAGYVWWSSRDSAVDRLPVKNKAAPENEMAGKIRNLLASSQREQARDAAILHLQAHREDVQVQCLLAKALWSLGQADDARRVLAEVDRVSPSQALALWLHGEMAKAAGEGDYLNYFAKAVNSPTVEAEMNSLYALELLSRGEDEQAARYVQRSVGAGLSDAATLQAQAQLEMKTARYAAAISHLQDALKLDRSSAACWRLLAEAQLRIGKSREAMQTLEEALKVCRDKPALNLMLGHLREEVGLPAAAADAFAQAADPEVLPKDQRVEAAVSAAMNYYHTQRYALAMKYIDLAATFDASDTRVIEWMPKIEDARFGPASKPAN